MKKSIASFLILVTVVAAGTAHAEKIKRIINGQEAAPTAPWMVSLSDISTDASEGSFCGAALISESWIVTAAHCAESYTTQPNHMRVSYGSQDLQGGNLKSQIADGIVVNENFNEETVENDIALIHISQPITDIPFLPIASEPITNEQVTVLGWGYTIRPVNGVDNSQYLPSVLRSAKVPLQSDDVCKQGLGKSFFPDVMFCAGILSSAPKKVDGVDSCYGDSGGPVVANINGVDQLVGLVSWGLDCASNKTYGVYTKVSSFLQWLAQPKVLSPFIKDKPLILGKSAVGSHLYCETGELGGDAVTSESYRWIDAESGKILKRGKGLVVRPSYNNISLQCIVSLANAGGKVQMASDATYRMSAQKVLRKFRPASPFLMEAEVRCSKEKCRIDFQTTTGVSAVSAFFDSASCANHVCRSKHKVVAQKSTENNWVIEWKKAKYATPSSRTQVQVELQSFAATVVPL